MESISLCAVGFGIFLIMTLFFHVVREGYLRAIGCVASILISLELVASGLCISPLVYGYIEGYCQDSSSAIAKEYAPFKDQGYSFADSFFLVCVHFSLLLISIIIIHCSA